MRFAEKANTTGQMANFTMGSGTKTKCMGLGSWSGRMERNMKANL